jgi:uncharacterized iron-regulated membrane protein
MIAVLRRLHRWAGLLLALPLIVQGVTGFIMAVDPLLATHRPAPAGLLSPTAQIAAEFAAAQAVAPADLVPRRYRAAAGEASIVEFAPATSQQPTSDVIIDPGSLRVLMVAESGSGFYRWVHSVHETLLLGPAGRNIIGGCGIGLCMLCGIGLPLWWPAQGRWRRALTVSRQARGQRSRQARGKRSRQARGHRLQRELHGAAGIWMLAVLLLQGFSGVALAFPQFARAIAGLPAPGPRAGGGGTPDIEVAVAAALKAVPHATLREVRLPAGPGRAIMAALLPDGEREGAPPAIVMLDPATRLVLSVQDPRLQTWPARVLGWLRALHAGEGLSLAWRLMVCATGVALPLMAATGVSQWWLRRRQRRHAAAVWNGADAESFRRTT